MNKLAFVLAVVAAIVLPVILSAFRGRGRGLPRPDGPCDVYAAGGTPCASAHSTVRALYRDYDGPLYQVMRQSDGRTLDIGVVRKGEGEAGGYADAAAQDRFCKGTYCWITVIYDQGPMGNHLRQAPRGRFGGHAMGGFNNLPLADWAPVTIMGHKVYGVFIAPGMGLRCNDTRGIAVDDQAEGQYWVVSGSHYNDGCCFDYGNAEIDSNNDGDGTMEAAYFGNAHNWHRGMGPGPWILTDQENHLAGCSEDQPEAGCDNVPTVPWRFVTATADGEPHRWRMMGGDARDGGLETYYDGVRIINDRNSYDPMRKQGAIVLGNGGDNSVSSQGTFYEGAITMAGFFPSEETNQAVQANIVAAGYDVRQLTIAGSADIDEPKGLMTFAPGEEKTVSVKFVNTGKSLINGLRVKLELPRGWKCAEKAIAATQTVLPGQAVITGFKVTAGKRPLQGDISAEAVWRGGSVSAAMKVRCAPPVKINEFCLDGGRRRDNSYVELYNTGDSEVDLSGWTLAMRPVHMPLFSHVVLPEGTVLAQGEHYVMGLAPSGLSVKASRGDSILYLRRAQGLVPGDTVIVGTGAVSEIRIVKSVRTPEKRHLPTSIWQPLPDGPVLSIPKGSSNIPVTNTQGFRPGDRMAIGYGAKYPVTSGETEDYEVVTITGTGTCGTQAYLTYDARPGDTVLRVSSVENIRPGDVIRLDIDSRGHGIETVKVKSVGTASEKRPFFGPMSPEEAGSGLQLEEPLKFAHSANLPFSVRGQGISFEPATAQVHISNEPVLALDCYVVLEEPLSRRHPIDEPVFSTKLNFGFDGKADLYYGGPAFPLGGSMRGLDGKTIHRGGPGSAAAGSIILRTPGGVVADALNYGLIVDPWAAEGYQGASGKGERGNCVGLYPPEMSMGRLLRMPGVSYSRVPDGWDQDDNQRDFRISVPTPGETNIVKE